MLYPLIINCLSSAVPGEIPRALTSYGKSVASIEIIKDGHLQKIYFPLPEKVGLYYP